MDPEKDATVKDRKPSPGDLAERLSAVRLESRTQTRKLGSSVMGANNSLLSAMDLSRNREEHKAREQPQ